MSSSTERLPQTPIARMEDLKMILAGYTQDFIHLRRWERDEGLGCTKPRGIVFPPQGFVLDCPLAKQYDQEGLYEENAPLRSECHPA